MSDRTDIEIPNTGLLPETQVEHPAPATEGGEREKSPRELTMERIAANAEAPFSASMARTASTGPSPE